MTRVCNPCGRTLSVTSEFFFRDHRRKGFQIVCKACSYTRHKIWRKANSKRVSNGVKVFSHKRRLMILTHYGGDPPKCVCCGETRHQFLALDHIDGGGIKHRKSIGVKGGTAFYAWIKKNNFPEGFRVLCHNCNTARGCYGVCPHEEERNAVHI